MSTCLIVVTADARVARWAARPILSLQPGSPFTPLVLGPEQVPWVTEPVEAEHAPELAVLSALAHAESPGGLEVVAAALIAIDALERERAILYHELIVGSLPVVMAEALEQIMLSRKYEIRSAFGKKYMAEGRAEGREEGREEARRGLRVALRAVIQARLGEIPAGMATAIDASHDAGELLGWIERAGAAIDADALRDLFRR